jgi:hypothetical protein
MDDAADSIQHFMDELAVFFCRVRNARLTGTADETRANTASGAQTRN